MGETNSVGPVGENLGKIRTPEKTNVIPEVEPVVELGDKKDDKPEGEGKKNPDIIDVVELSGDESENEKKENLTIYDNQGNLVE